MTPTTFLRLALAAMILHCTCATTIASEPSPPPFETIKPAFPPISFPATVPPEFSAKGKSQLSIRRLHIDAESKGSLRWDWEAPGASLVFTHPEAFKHISGADPDPITYGYCMLSPLSTFKIWVFNETASEDRLWFEIGTTTRTDSRFYMNLNFSGWRKFAAMYGRDIRAIPGPDADTLRILAPPSLAKGSLSFDQLEPRSESDTRAIKQTPQAPWVRNEKAAAAGGGTCTDPKIAIYQHPETIDIPTPATLTPSQKDELKSLTDTYFQRFSVPITPLALSTKQLDALREIYAQHKIVREGKWVTGDEISSRIVWANITRLVTAWAQETVPETKEELLQKSFDLIDLVTQLGHRGLYGTNDGFVRPVLLFRTQLETTDRWTPLMEKLADIYEMQQMAERDLYGNADVFNTLLHGQLALILLQPDRPKKWHDMMMFRRYLDHTADQGEIKGDGSYFHHGMTYSYGIPAIEAIGDVLCRLKDTSFFPHRSHEIARRVAIAMRFYSCGRDMPHFIGGRWRNPCWVSPALFRNMAECGNPTTGETPDREMAAFYLWYDIKDVESERYLKLGIKPLQPSGNLTLPYSVASFQRRDDWMVAVQGQKRFFQASESYAYQAGNTMGRYISYGQTYIHSKREKPDQLVTAKASGFYAKLAMDQGWDYARWPGTTARAIPNEALRSHFEVEEMITAEPFAGGTSLDGNGMFAMKLQEDLPDTPEKNRLAPCRWWLGEQEYEKRIKDSAFDPSFRARKSWFFFDDAVVCLGSGITCEDSRYPINTTLFQNMLNLPGRLEHFSLGGNSSNIFPMDLELQANQQTHWLLDSCDNGYWIPKGNNTLRILRKERSLPYHTHWTLDRILSAPPQKAKKYEEMQAAICANTGKVELAWFDHGAAPSSPAGYEYAIVVDTTAEAMQSFAAAPRYRVLRKDNVAHVVVDAPTKITAYALFEANHDLNPAATASPTPLLRTASKPCLIMFKETAAGTFKMSFADPNPGLVERDKWATLRGNTEWTHDGLSAPPTVTRVVLAGNWTAKGADVTIIPSPAPGRTELELRCVESAPVTLELIHKR